MDSSNPADPVPPPAPRRGAGRPRAFDRQQALDVALDLFWRQGFEGTSTTQLTAAMGIAQPSLYAAFGSKEALYREALALYLQRHGGFLSVPLSGDLPLREAIEALLLGAAQQFSDTTHTPGCMVSSGGLHGAPEHETLFNEMKGLRQAAQAAIQARLDRGRLTGELSRSCDTATLAAFLAMVVQGMAVQARDGADPARLRAMAMLAMQAWPGSDDKQHPSRP